ncbi:MAG: hypothetical protein IKM46_04410 [Clostridia bacterium]|nr:hypothetical protein [Clostridia bacterium]
MMLHARVVDTLKVNGASREYLAYGDDVGSVVFYYPSKFVKALDNKSE